MSSVRQKNRQASPIGKLPPRSLVLLRQLGRLADAQGISLNLVGGVVRDLFLNKENWDLDLTAGSNGISFGRLVAKRYGAGFVPFERFQTCRVIFPDGRKVDIATARRESYVESAALPDVESGSLTEDLYRRDFTINAMAISLNAATFGALHDPFGGRHDLKAGVIRVLHDGSFVDDPTRIFRAIRFVQRFGFDLEPRTQKLLTAAAATNLIQRLSGPRLCREILLLFGEPDPGKSVQALVRLKLLRFLDPNVRYGKKARRVVAALPYGLRWWKRRFPKRFVDRQLVYLMAVLSESRTVIVKSVIRRLHLSSAQSKVVEWSGERTTRLSKKILACDNMRPSQIYHLLAGISDEGIVLLVTNGFTETTRIAVRRRLIRLVARFLQRGQWIRINLTGEDLKRLGLAPGPRFRNILDRLRDARLDGTITTRSEEQALARRLVRRMG